VTPKISIMLKDWTFAGEATGDLAIIALVVIVAFLALAGLGYTHLRYRK
jgi:hypothetical protein